MSWPPTIGEIPPQAEAAFGIREKLSACCLNPAHEIGGPKAQRFAQMLGIGLTDVDYVAEALQAGVLDARVTDVRDNAPFGVLCEVRIPVTGLRARGPRGRRHHSMGATQLRRRSAAGDRLHRRVNLGS